MNKVPKIVCVSVLVCSNATLTDDAGPQSNKSYRSWFWQRQFLRSGHWRDRSEFTLCPRCVSSAMQGFAFAANVRNDAPRRSILNRTGGRQWAYSVEKLVAASPNI